MNDFYHCVAFVDPIISSVYLAEELHRNKIKIIAVFTLTNLSEAEKRLRFRPELFDEVIYLKENTKANLIAISETLKNKGVKYVFYGYEASVPFTDQLTYLVCPSYSNDPNTSQLRFDKYAMQDALNKSNIPHVKQLKVNNQRPLSSHQIRELKDWTFPVIAKPIEGGLSIGVKECDSVHAINNLLTAKQETLLHSVEIKAYVIQERLLGDEFFVDTFSLSGEHFVVSVQRYKKIIYAGHPVYRYFEIMDPNSHAWTRCANYTLKVLDAVGLKNGFGHTELFLTSNGPRLIEVNPRVSGFAGFGNKLAENVLHINQPKVLSNRLASQPYYPPLKLFYYGITVCLQNWQPKKIAELNTDLIKTLASYKDHLVLKTAGSQLGSPKTLIDTVANVLLINHDKEKLMQDYQTLIQWEQSEQLF